MSILDSLNKAKQQSKQKTNDDLIRNELFMIGVSDDIIDDVLLEPVDQWQNFVDYFRNRK